MNTNNTSSVASLRRQIDEEWQAARLAMHAPAIVARHRIITKRMENVGMLHDRLQELVGEQEATEFVVRMMEGGQVR